MHKSMHLVQRARRSNEHISLSAYKLIYNCLTRVHLSFSTESKRGYFNLHLASSVVNKLTNASEINGRPSAVKVCHCHKSNRP